MYFLQTNNCFFFFLCIFKVTVCNRWFRPELSQNEAKNFLHGQEDGTFIVRFSSRVGVPFTLTRVLDGKIHQVFLSFLINLNN